MVEVVAAILWRDGRVLVCQRPPHKARGMLWEFAGGKIEEGETGEEAIVRELQEELGVTVQPQGVWMDVVHSYPDLSIHLTVFDAVLVAGEPRPLEHHALCWARVEELDRLPFCPADVELVKALQCRKDRG